MAVRGACRFPDQTREKLIHAFQMLENKWRCCPRRSMAIFRCNSLSLSNKKNIPMGLVYANIELINKNDIFLSKNGYIKEKEIRRINMDMMVDSGALMLAINSAIKEQLGLEFVEERIATLADGTSLTLEVVGPIEVKFKNRRCSVDALVLPGNAEPLLGAIPMQDMDVVTHPQKEELIVNPEHPNYAGASLK
jgi:clan AA aspartic protease